MEIVVFNNLPTGVHVRGNLYNDHSMIYLSGDVLEIELPTGFTIDVGWDADSPDTPFRIVVYREYFGDHFVDFSVKNIDDVTNEIYSLVKAYTQPYSIFSSCAASEPRDRKREVSFDILRTAAIADCGAADVSQVLC